jgi:hypothetical protein
MLPVVIARLHRDLFPIFWVYRGDGGGDGYRPDGPSGGSGMPLQDPSGLAGATRGIATPPRWTPDPQWPPAPLGWQFWEPDTEHPGLSAGGYGAGGFGGGDHPKGTTILILGVLSLLCCGLFTGIPAIIMGKKALEESETAHYSNAAVIKAGWICGIIGTVLSGSAPSSRSS